MGRSSIWPQVLAAGAVSLTLLSAGFHFGWPSSSIMKLQSEDSDLLMTMHQISWTISILFFGCIGGAIPALILVDNCGRKMTLLLTAVPFVISSVLLGFGRTYWLLYIARFAAGIGIGVSFTVAPMYIGEIAEGRIRGGLCLLIPIMVLIGDLISMLIGPMIARAALGIIGIIIPIVCATSLIWIPESPYYYSMKRNPNETRKSVAWFRGTSDVAEEVQQIDNSMALYRRKGVNFISLFTVLSSRKALLAVVILQTAQAVSGNQTLSFYTHQFIYATGFALGFQVVSVIILLVNFVTIVCVAFLTDKVGRRPLLLISSILGVVFLLAEALLVKLETDTSDVPIVRWLPLMAYIGFVISHAIGLGTLPIVVAAEIFPCEAKALGLALHTVFHFIAQVAISSASAFLMYSLDAYIGFCIFAALSLVSAILTYFFVPETKGRSLSQIQVGFQNPFKPQA